MACDFSKIDPGPSLIRTPEALELSGLSGGSLDGLARKKKLTVKHVPVAGARSEIEAIKKAPPLKRPKRPVQQVDTQQLNPALGRLFAFSVHPGPPSSASVYYAKEFKKFRRLRKAS
jgi:hypothetical protein